MPSFSFNILKISFHSCCIIFKKWEVCCNFYLFLLHGKCSLILGFHQYFLFIFFFSCSLALWCIFWEFCSLNFWFHGLVSVIHLESSQPLLFWQIFLLLPSVFCDILIICILQLLILFHSSWMLSIPFHSLLFSPFFGSLHCIVRGFYLLMFKFSDSFLSHVKSTDAPIKGSLHF